MKSIKTIKQLSEDLHKWIHTETNDVQYETNKTKTDVVDSS